MLLKLLSFENYLHTTRIIAIKNLISAKPKPRVLYTRGMPVIIFLGFACEKFDTLMWLVDLAKHGRRSHADESFEDV